MQSPAELLQARVAAAVLGGNAAPLRTEILGGPEPLARLAIHQRHYDASLLRAVQQKFPACAWLIGDELFEAAARAFVHAHPPTRPCIAEYGHDFPPFLAAFAGSAAPPYVAPFGELEWAVGQASIAVAVSSLEWRDLVAAGVEKLLRSTVHLQPGLHYRRSDWALDEPFTRYLREAEPRAAPPAARPTCIEVRGAYGELSLNRLDAASYAFRSSLAAGSTVEAAAGAALDADSAFDAGAALRDVVAAGLAIGLSHVSGANE